MESVLPIVLPQWQGGCMQFIQLLCDMNDLDKNECDKVRVQYLHLKGRHGCNTCENVIPTFKVFGLTVVVIYKTPMGRL